jgi:hypothetical protein
MDTEQTNRLSSLRFFLYERPVHPELFEILSEVKLHLAGYEASLWITGCSHVVSFFRQDKSLVEVVADSENPLPKRGLAIELPFRGEKAHEQKSLDGINYMMNLQAEKMSRRVYKHMHRELVRQGKKKGMFLPLPKLTHDSLEACSYIDYDAKPNGLHVLTYHALPDTMCVIKTQSIFELG